MSIWRYNDKCCLNINEHIVTEYRVDVSKATPGGKIDLCSFTKDMPYIMDLTLSRNQCEKAGEQVKGYTISEHNKIH